MNHPNDPLFRLLLNAASHSGPAVPTPPDPTGGVFLLLRPGQACPDAVCLDPHQLAVRLDPLPVGAPQGTHADLLPLAPHRPLHEDLCRHEVCILWLPGFDPRKVDYVRASSIDPRARRGRPRSFGEAILCGWSELAPDAPSSSLRRVFWLKPYDRPLDPKAPTYPWTALSEAVDPLTLAPGVGGCVTRRVWGSRTTAAAIRNRPPQVALAELQEAGRAAAKLATATVPVPARRRRVPRAHRWVW